MHCSIITLTCALPPKSLDSSQLTDKYERLPVLFVCLSLSFYFLRHLKLRREMITFSYRTTRHSTMPIILFGTLFKKYYARRYVEIGFSNSERHSNVERDRALVCRKTGTDPPYETTVRGLSLNVVLDLQLCADNAFKVWNPRVVTVTAHAQSIPVPHYQHERPFSIR